MSFDYSGPKDRIVTEIDRIADALSGVDEVENPTGDRLRDSLKRIADYYEEAVGTSSDVEKLEDLDDATSETVVGQFNKLLQGLRDVGIIETSSFKESIQKIVDSVEGHADRQYNSNKVNAIGVNKSDDGKSAEIVITLSAKVADLKDFDGGNGWGVHKWLGIGIGVGVSPITLLKYNGQHLTEADIEEAALCGMSSGGKFVRWVAADLVLAGDNTQASKDTFVLSATGYSTVTYKLRIVEPSD